MPFQVYECSRASCRFRFPLEWSPKASLTCPACGAPTSAAGQLFEPTGVVRGERAEQPEIIALLDNIRSIWNVGAMFRIADGCGISHLHLCGITATPEHPRVVKTALGAQEAVPWSYYRNGVDAARELLAAGCRLWALESSAGALPLTQRPDLLPDRPTVLAVGNEKAGIDPGILALCEQAVFIPMVGRKGSLNAAVAFGIAAYKLCFG